MAEVSPREGRWLGPPLMLGFSLFVPALDFLLLLATYLVLAPIAPAMFGEVAVSPARFAGWIALVKLPMTLTHMLAFSWRGRMALATRGEVPDPPVGTGWRRALAPLRVWAVDAAGSVIAALIVFHYVAHPGDAHVWQLVAVTAVGPLLLPRVAAGPFRLLRWWWRRKHPHDARHARFDEEPIKPDAHGH